MFNKKDASLEIAEAMESHLITHAVEKKEEQLTKFAKAIDYLNTAAELFDDLGLKKEAEYTTSLLEIVAKKKSKKKPSKSKTKSKPRKSKKNDPAIEGLTSEKMEDNLKEKGWVFNADDHSDGCMCSMCMDVNDVRHGEDCICSHCMDADDNNNYHYDTSEDASHDRNFADILNDFEDEVEMPQLKHHKRHNVIVPPKHRDTLIPSFHPPKNVDFEGISNWDYVRDPGGVPFGRER